MRRCFPQSRQRSREPGLHRALGATNGRCRFGLAHVQQVPTGDYEALLLAQRVKRFDEVAVALAIEDRILGRWGRIGPRAALCEPELQPRPPACRPSLVACLVGHDREQPGSKRTAAAEPIQGIEGFDECSLSRIFGITGISGDEVCGSECDPLMSNDQLLICGRVSRTRSRYELGFVQWSALHRLIYLSRYTVGVGWVPEVDSGRNDVVEGTLRRAAPSEL